MEVNNQLEVIDGKKVTKQEKDDIMKNEYAVSWEHYFYQHSSDQRQSFRPFSMRTDDGRESSSLLHKNHKITKQLPYEFHESLITTLELDSCNLLNLKRLPDQ